MPEDKANAALNNPQMKKFSPHSPSLQECIIDQRGKHETELKQQRRKSSPKAAG